MLFIKKTYLNGNWEEMEEGGWTEILKMYVDHQMESKKILKKFKNKHWSLSEKARLDSPHENSLTSMVNQFLPLKCLPSVNFEPYQIFPSWGFCPFKIFLNSVPAIPVPFSVSFCSSSPNVLKNTIL